MRNVLAVILGVAVAGFAVMGVESVGHAIYPPPAGLSPDNPHAYAAYLARAPFLALAFGLVAWAVGAFVGGAVASKLAVGRRPRRFGVFVGLILLMLGALEMWRVEHPSWFALATPFACLIPAGFGGLVGARRSI